MLDRVGWVQQVIVNQRTGHLLDGHLRVSLALKKNEATIPVVYVDVSPEEERLVLASLDPIAGLAGIDHEKQTELLAQVSTDFGKEFVDEMSEAFGLDTNAGGKPSSDGSLLSIVDIALGEPKHTVTTGDVWKVGRHVLICADVVTGWPAWKDYLEPGVLFAPYAGPFVPVTVKAEEHRLLMVQPDPYIAGHTLDRAAEVIGDSAIAKLS